MEGWSWELQRPHLKAGNFAVIVGGRGGELAIADYRIGHERASARIDERAVAPERCLEPGLLAALNCGRLAAWSKKNRAVGDRDFCVDGE
eukprot:1386738-Prymnesium_polylepis.1